MFCQKLGSINGMAGYLRMVTDVDLRLIDIGKLNI